MRSIEWMLVGAATLCLLAPATGTSWAQSAQPDSVSADSVAAPAQPAPAGRRPQPEFGADREQIKEMLDNMGRDEIEGKRAWLRRKNPKVAMYSSMLLPGLGQVYNGRRIKAGIAAGAFAFYFGNMVLNWRYHKEEEVRKRQFETGTTLFNYHDRLSEYYREEARTFLWWSGGAWLLILIDSWIDAHLYDVRAYTPPANEPISRMSIPDSGPSSYITLTFGFK